MRLKTLATALLALALLVPASAGAYTPRHGKPCRHGYVKRFKHVKIEHGKRKGHRRKVRVCVKAKHQSATKIPPGPGTPAKTKLHAHLDPTFVRNPLDPFQVTYAYSASATQEVLGAATLSAEEPAPLPSGVLAFYSDGKLECAENVGGTKTGAECPVSYQALGSHEVTTIYSSGEQSATESETEVIEPLGTSARIGLSYEQFGDPAELASGWYWVGDLKLTTNSDPAGAGSAFDCGEPPAESNGVLTANGCFILGGSEALTEHVYATGACSSSDIHIQGSPPSTIEPSVLWPQRDDLEQGVFHLRATAGSHQGYAASETTVPLQFTITWRPEGCP